MIRRVIAAILAALLLYAGLLVARLPASWVYSQVADSLPVQVTDIRGSVWDGSARLVYAGLQLDSLHWQLAFWPLLRGEQALTLQVDDSGLRFNASLLRDGQQFQLEVRDLWLDVSRVNPLQLLPAGIAVGGEINAPELRIAVDADAITVAQGRLQWAPAYLLAPQSYSHPGFVGQLQVDEKSLSLIVNDRGGEFAVEGIGWLARQGDWRYRINIVPPANPPAALAQALQQLGRRDAQGNYQVEAAGQL